MDVLANLILVSISLYIQIYQIITLYTLNLHKFLFSGINKNIFLKISPADMAQWLSIDL